MSGGPPTLVPLCSATRIQATNSWTALHTLRTSISLARQAKGCDGFLGGALLWDKQRVFWTVTNWRDEAAMIAYRDQGLHRRLMPKARQWFNDFATARWEQEDHGVATWVEVHQRIQEEQADRSYAAPASRRVIAVTPTNT